MDGAVSSDSRLHMSISFGKFENDELCWGKWSPFSQNKYLDEAGSLSARGSVAQKKAYFEAHYKKIATKKAERDDVMEPANLCCNLEDSAGFDAKLELHNEEEDSDVVVNGVQDLDLRSMAMVEQTACCNDLMKAAIDGETLDCKDQVAELGLEQSVSVKEETPLMDSQKFAETSATPKKETSSIRLKNAAQKATPSKKDRNLAGTKKMAASSLVKPSKATTPNDSKLRSSSTPISSTNVRKKTESPQPENRKSSVIENRREAQRSLYTSLNLQSSKSSAVSRRSLIMEKMGDKEIVKRAFKSFQHQINGHASAEKTSLNQSPQVSSTPLKPKKSSTNPRKENKGLKSMEKTLSPWNKSAQPSSPLLSGSQKRTGPEGQSIATNLPGFGWQIDQRSEKRKQFLMTLEANSRARQVKNAHLSESCKVESEIRKPKQMPSNGASPISSFYTNR